MTELELRDRVVQTALKYLGAKEGSDLHKEIIQIFNTVKPDGGRMGMLDPWCAAFASAIEIEALGVTKAKKFCPLSYNCGTIVSKAKKEGIWIEKDSYAPKVADWILYDWQDSGKGDDKGSPDHVGIVVNVTKKQIVVIEGNKRDRVETRTLKINGRCIRGFVAIPYGKIATTQIKVVTKPAKDTKEPKKVKVGSTVRIKKGAHQYGKTQGFLPKVYEKPYKVIEIAGNRVVIADGKTVIGAVAKSDCIVQ